MLRFKTCLKLLLALIMINWMPIQAEAISFSTPVNLTGSFSSSTTSSDFNADGKADLAVASTLSNNVSVFLGDGAGSFSAAVGYNVGTSPRSVTSADFNGDGQMDLAVANRGAGLNTGDNGNVSILLGDGMGGFSAAVNILAGRLPQFVLTADFNGDNKVDIAVLNNLSNDVSILLGNGSGDFVLAGSFPVAVSPSSMTSADFNGDGNADIAAPEPVSNTVWVLLGDGAGGFVSRRRFPAGLSALAVASADFNADGKVDLAIADGRRGVNNVGNLSILLGDGTGGFAIPLNNAVVGRPQSVVSTDINGDGNVDLVVASQTPDNLSVLLGNGMAGFAAGVNIATGVTPLSVISSDFNNDGKVDLAMASPMGASVLMNQSVPLTPQVTLSLNASSYITGDILTLTRVMAAAVSATNADIYLGLQLPDGTLLVKQPNGSLSAAITPLQANVPVQSATDIAFTYTFTGAEPAGTYTWLAALMQPGTLNVIGTMASRSFTFTP